MPQKRKLELSNAGQIIVKNRRFRRKWKNTAKLNGLSKKYYTTKRTFKRRKNGKVTQKRKKSRK